MKRVVLSWLLVSLLCFGLVACSSKEAGLRELKRLCEKDAGLTINRVVEVDGYFDAYSGDGWAKALVSGSYKFYEFCDESPSPSKFNLFPEAGCYRLKKILHHEGNCYGPIEQVLERFDRAGYQEFRKTNCVLVEKIEGQEAMYGFYSNLDVWTRKNSKSKFRRSDTYIKDYSSDEILGRFVNYSYIHSPVTPVSRSCDDVDNHYSSYKDTTFISRVLKPKK